ncbi:MAG TPA: ankyrin repeat domain-containing protein [Bryobacteraceae bacterium]|nr:ankyrin repeat domain-containing protein [Bryobacteraceae bacterium]
MTIRLAACTAVLALCVCAYGADSPVSDAAMKGDKAALRTLLDQKADVNAPQTDGATAIQWAAYRDDIEMASLLITAGANVKLANREGATPLYLASIHGNPVMIDKLLNAGADPNERGPEGETPLMLASRAGNLDAIKVLLDHQADINAADKIRGTTALMWASEQSHPAAVQLLIARGAKVSAATEPDTRNSRNNLANTVTQRLNSSFGVVGQARARAGTAPGSPGPANPAGAASAGPPKKTPDGEAGGDDVAIFFGPPRKKDGGGLTPLVYAAREDCLECAKILLDAGADVNQRTHYGWTALLTATQNRHYKLASYLLDHGANPNIANNGGWTPLYLATDNRNIESGDYPVRAPDMEHLDYMKLLIDKGANVNARICGTDSTEKKCIGDSTETRNNFTMQWLFEDGATPFLRAAQSGDIPLMKLLLAHGADPKIFTAHNVTPLAVASGIGWVEGVTFEWSEKETLEAVKMCLDLGIDPNVKDDEGRTSLHGAAHKGRPEVIQLLVDHGANLDAHDGGSRDSVNGALLGKTWVPLDWARGLVRVGVQSAIPHPEAEKLLVKLMTDRGMPIPPPPASSICLTKGLNGCQ